MKTSTSLSTTLTTAASANFNIKHASKKSFTKLLHSLSLLFVLLFVNMHMICAQISTYPTTIDFTATQPTYITTPSGTSYNTTLTDCNATVTGGVSYTSSSKTWTLSATKCARIIYTIKQPSTVRGVTVSNNQNSVTRTTLGVKSTCITDTADFNYDGSNGNILISFVGASGGSGQAIVSVTIFDAIVLPVAFTSFYATQQGNGVSINWCVGTEINISKYVVEKSTNTLTFNNVGSISASGANTYNWVDNSTTSNDAYYRIKAVETTGSITYSNVLKINANSSKIDVSVAPNPVTSSSFTLQLNALTKGSYIVSILNTMGQIVYRSTINHAGGIASENIQLPSSLQNGVYTLSVSNASFNINKMLFINQ